jgi:hypothetical protein
MKRWKCKRVLSLRRCQLVSGEFLVWLRNLFGCQEAKEVLRMKNVEAKVQGDKLIITIDLTKNFGLSGSGKSIIIASTEGNISVPVPGHEDVKIGVNVYRPGPR